MLFDKILDMIEEVDYTTSKYKFEHDLKYVAGAIFYCYDSLTIKESHALLREIQLLKDKRLSYESRK